MRPSLSPEVRVSGRDAEGLGAELRLDVPGDVGLVGEAVEIVSRHVEAAFVDRRLIRFNLAVALSEALANAILYGCRGDASLGVTVRVLYGPRAVEAEVADRGGGFDHRFLQDPTLPGRRTLPRGRGLFLIRNLVDEVRFNDRGNSICLVLRRA